MHIVAQLRPIDLHNFQANYQRVVSFWVPVNYPSLNELVSMPGLWRIPIQFRLPPNTSLCKLPSAMILLFLDLQGALFHSPSIVEDHSKFHSSPEAFEHMSPHCRFSDLGPFRLRIFSAQVGNRTRAHGDESNSTRDQRVKSNERRTRPCHRAYYIRGSTPFHSCVEVRSPKLVSSEDQTGARAPSASYCSTEGVTPLQYTLRHQAESWGVNHHKGLGHSVRFHVLRDGREVPHHGLLDHLRDSWMIYLQETKELPLYTAKTQYQKFETNIPRNETVRPFLLQQNTVGGPTMGI
jgi:hypothetical protein